MKSPTALFNLQGKVALVTGASSGLGLHFSKVLAAVGASVVVAARRTDRLSMLVEEIEGDGGVAIAVTMDVTNDKSVQAAFDQAEEKFGTVDIVINNAGVEKGNYFLNDDEDNWDFIMNTNLKGAWCVAKEACRRLVEAKKKGSIVNIASLLGITTQLRQSAYSVSKAGLIHLTHSIALEMGRYGIRVNAIAPGYFKSAMTDEYFATDAGKEYLKSIPSRRLGEAEELTGPLLLLTSEAGAYLNGIVIPVDGGHLVAGL